MKHQLLISPCPSQVAQFYLLGHCLLHHALPHLPAHLLFPSHKDESETRVLFLNFDIEGEALLLCQQILYNSCLPGLLSILPSADFTAFSLSLIMSLPFCFALLLYKAPFSLQMPLPIPMADFHML